jgi:hypothetical protein
MLNVIQRAFVFEIQDGKDPQSKAYWGRWGIFTHNDFGAKAKDRYRGLKMLDRISDQRLQLTGKGTWVKAVAAKNQNGNTEVVLANYGTGSTAEKVPLTFGFNCVFTSDPARKGMRPPKGKRSRVEHGNHTTFCALG